MIRKPIKEIDFTFKAGEKLSSSSLNLLITKINEVVREINEVLFPGEVNVNREMGDMTKEWTLEQVLKAVPEDRLSPGIKLTFLTSSGWVTWTEKNGNGETDDFTEIDGGQW